MKLPAPRRLLAGLDAYEEPGRLLYRFDSVIANQGGTLDLFRDPGSGGVRQAIWPGGVPSTAPRPDEEPSAADAQIVDRSASGAGFEYAVEKTHEHWHFSSAALYELEPEFGPARVAEKIGFCMFDSFGPATYFGFSTRGAGDETWCGFDAPGQALVRMGLSPGAADRYSSQRSAGAGSGPRGPARPTEGGRSPSGSRSGSSAARGSRVPAATTRAFRAFPATGPARLIAALF